MKPLLIFSACLLGHDVRYDGRCRHEPEIRQRLERDFHLEAVCPEVEAGLPRRRPPARLQGSPLQPRFVTFSTGRDESFRIMSAVRSRLSGWGKIRPLGAVLKAGSPSCASLGMTQVFTEDGRTAGRSMGLFARALLEAFPWIVLADERFLRYGDNLERFVASARAAQGVAWNR